MADIKEIEDVLMFGLAVADGYQKSMGNGTFDWNDIFKFTKAFTKFPQAIINIADIADEFKDLSDDERMYLIGLIQTDLHLDTEKASKIAVEAFRIGMSLGVIITTLKK